MKTEGPANGAPQPASQANDHNSGSGIAFRRLAFEIASLVAQLETEFNPAAYLPGARPSAADLRDAAKRLDRLAAKVEAIAAKRRKAEDLP